MSIKHNETRFTDTSLPIRIQKCAIHDLKGLYTHLKNHCNPSPPPPPPPNTFLFFVHTPTSKIHSFTPHQDNFISMAFCPQETLFSGIALTIRGAILHFQNFQGVCHFQNGCQNTA